MFAYSRLKGTVTKTAVLTLWIIIEKTENEQYFFIKTILGVDNFTNNIDLSEKKNIIKKWIKMTPLNICVCFCWACSSSVELSFNSNLVLRQSELLLLISPSVGRFMHFYHNKWESFITPDTTRLKRICGVTVCTYVSCIFLIVSFKCTLFTATVLYFVPHCFLPLYQDLRSGPYCKCREEERFSQGQPLFDGAGVDGGREKIGAAVWLHLSAVAPQSIWGGNFTLIPPYTL